jgi:hypothetical protein
MQWSKLRQLSSSRDDDVFTLGCREHLSRAVQRRPSTAHAVGLERLETQDCRACFLLIHGCIEHARQSCYRHSSSICGSADESRRPNELGGYGRSSWRYRSTQTSSGLGWLIFAVIGFALLSRPKTLSSGLRSQLPEAG